MKLIDYTSYFVSFVLENLKEAEIKKIKSIILFGSVASGTATDESDVDLFFDVDLNKKQIKSFNKKIKIISDDFISSNIGIKFRLNKVSNEIKPLTGRLNEWSELKDSISKNGIVLYGKYISKIKGEPHLLIWWDSLKIKNRGAFLNKLYGFKVKNKEYKGLLEKVNGKKIGKSSILLPLKEKDRIKNIFEKYKVDYKSKIVSLSE